MGPALMLLAAPLFAQTPASAPAETVLAGAPVFAANCAGCHGADGRGGEHAPNIATVPEVQRLADHDLETIIHNGIAGAGMPAFTAFSPQKLTDVVLYLRSLQGRGHAIKLPGDADRGQALYFGKAQCAQCHMVNGRGGFYGSDLSFYGADTPAEQIRALLVDPSANFPSDKKETIIVTKAGRTITGMLKASSNFTLTLQTRDGSFQFVPRSEISSVATDAHSTMHAPSNLTPQEMDDLLSYLLRAGDENARRLPVHTAKAEDDDN